MGKKSYGEEEKGLNSGTYGMIGKGTHIWGSLEAFWAEIDENTVL